MNEAEIIAAARKIADPQDREAFLAEACKEDSGLRQRVEQALRPVELAEPVPASQGEQLTRALVAPGEGAAPPLESAGTRIGSYRLLEPIGEGGMGRVWLAEQEQPVRRLVALKIIKPGMDTREVIARFEAERQALARMDHPHIAKVLDAGETGYGRPFFVMELVRGTPITEYCDRRRITTRERLQLFCTVCHAVQHAHLKGIIHRDLKPSNVLVAEFDGQAVVKVIDFGLAKAIDSRLTEQTLFTAVGQMVGTPAYMSPEQADSGLDIDTRTDVYSLGVLLYELLTGVTPLDLGTIRRAGFTEMQRLIREYEPPRMSTRLSSLAGDSRVLAANRSTEVRKLIQLVRGDLDIIVLKALEKDRDRRYETPDSFAADVQRFLQREVIHARPASGWYRVRRFCTRNRGVVVAAALIASALLAGTTLSAWQAWRAQQAAGAERLARLEAQKRLTQIERGAEILGGIFQDLDLRRIEQEGTTVEQLLADRLKAAAAELDADAVGDPLVVARLQFLLATSLHSLGHAEEAVDLLRKASEARAAWLGPDHQETLACRHNLAESLVAVGQVAQALPLHLDILERSQATLGPTHYDTLGSMKDLGNCYIALGEFDAGLPLLEEALRLAQATVGEKDTLTLTGLNSLAVGYHRASRFDQALPLYEKTLQRRREFYGPEHYDTLTAINNLAACYKMLGQLEPALALMKEAYDLRKQKLGPDHPHTLISMNNVAVVMEAAGRGAEALSLYEACLALSEARLGQDHPDTVSRVTNLANCCRDLGQLDRAFELYREVVARNGRIHGQDSLAYAGALVLLGYQFVDRQRWQDAEPVLRECLALRERRLDAADWRVASVKSLLGAALAGQEKFEEAEPLLLAGYLGQKAQSDAIPAQGRAGIAQARQRLIRLYEQRGAAGDAEQAARWKAEPE